MTPHRYATPSGGLPAQSELTTDRAVFTEAYAVLPRGTMRDIVTSNLPFWEGTRLWVLARPLSGFAETFSQYVVEVSPGGGSDRPELDAGAEGVVDRASLGVGDLDLGNQLGEVSRVVGEEPGGPRSHGAADDPGRRGGRTGKGSSPQRAARAPGR